jgi:serine protease Do
LIVVLFIGVAWLVSSGAILAQKAEHPAENDVFTFAGRRGARTWLGVILIDVTPEKARELKLPGEYGAIVSEVKPDSPAAKAGLAANDVILEFAGERVRSMAQLMRLVRETPPGRTVSLEVSRDGQQRTLSVKLEARGEDSFGSWVRPMPPMPRVTVGPHIEIPGFDFDFGPSQPRLGISADNLTAQLADYFGVKEGKGVLVREVKPGSPAEKAGLKAGDCIVRVDDAEIGAVGDLRRKLGNHPGEKKEHTLTVVRDRQEQTLKVVIERPERFTRPETADDYDEYFGDLGEEIAELQNYAPQAQAEAERVKRELEAQGSQWQAQMQEQKAKLEQLQKELSSESQAQLREQAAQMARQADELKKQVEKESQQWKKDWLDKQRELQNQLRELRERTLEELEPVI